jgi:glucose/arabinose dehydrogenase
MRRLISLLALGAVLLALPALAQSTLPPGGSFLDDDGNIHEGAIEAIFAAGITTGCGAELFCPTRPVTRAEMAAFLIRALDEGEAPAAGTFSDVPPGEWYTGFVEQLAALEISVGYEDGTFRPHQPISRGEMAVLLIRALGETTGPFQGTFSDVAESEFFAGAVERLAALEITLGCGGGRFCPFDQVLRDQMASFISRAFDLPPQIPPPRSTTLSLEVIATGFDRPLFLTSPPGDSRLFVVEQGGLIRIVGGGTFLDVSALASDGGERGLLGLAFHPDYVTNGLFYVNYTDNSGDTRVVEYTRSSDPARADATSAQVLLTVDQPASNHNGGWMGFGPDGLLYIAMGDGGGANDQFGNGQNPTSLLGKILRMDVATANTEIWASGVRNPWRNAFDGNLLYIADVGQGQWEEVNVVSTLASAPNLGWPVMEGGHCLSGATCNPTGFVLPVAEYSHSQGCSITGGYVYRGSAIAGLAGTYFYSDFCLGTLRSFRFDGVAIQESKVWTDLGDLGSVSSFGEDSSGELYVLTFDGSVRKIVSG